MKKDLLKNTVMLYIMTFSTYLFNIIIIPYQTRVLGPEIWGNLGFIQSFLVYFQLVLDFGFLLSGTASVAQNRFNEKRLSEIFTAIMICKLILGILCLGVLLVLCFTVNRFYQDIILYLLFFMSVFINSLLPDYLYRGLEKMATITYRTVAIKLFFTICIVILLKEKSQYYIIPILNLCGSLGACIWVYLDLTRTLNIRFVRVKTPFIYETMRNSSEYFLSRIATTVYGASNTFILRFLYPTGYTLGYYISSEKLVSTARSAISPIADSLYPYMINSKDYNVIKRILIVLMPVITLGCFIIGVFAEPFCAWFFGEEFRESGRILQLLLPIIVMTLPTYLCGFPALSPLGMAKYANFSVVVGAIIQILQLLLLLLIGKLTVETVCIATCLTEFVVLLIRIYAVRKGLQVNKRD